MRRLVTAVLCWAAIFCGLFSVSHAQDAPDKFVTRSGTNFMLDGKPYYFAGANTYDLFTYGDGSSTTDTTTIENNYMDKARIDAQFQRLAAAGVKVVRTWGFNMESWHGFQTAWNPQTNTPTWNEAQWMLFDYILQSARQHGLRVIVTLDNYWTAYGGIRTRLQWSGETFSNMGANQVDAFFICTDCKEQYKTYAQRMLTRVNHYTGQQYRNDPTIFAWELMNEPRFQGMGDDSTSNTLRAWVDELAAYLKSLDANHLVGTGLEGHNARYGFGGDEGNDFVKIHQSPSVDFCSAHPYPTESWANMTLAQYQTLLTRWVDDCQNTVGKPLFLGEFNFHDGHDGHSRLDWFKATYAVLEGRNVGGSAFWWYQDREIDGTFGISQGDPELAEVLRHSQVMRAKWTSGTPSDALSASPAALSFTAAAQNALVTVSANVSWAVTTSASWLSASPSAGTNDGNFTVSVQSNTASASRTGTLTLSGGSLTRTITVTQAGTTTSTLTVSPATVSLGAAAGNATVTITSNVSWTASDDQSWLTLSAASGTGNASLTVTATANTASTARTATVTLSGGGLTGTVVVTQSGTTTNGTNVAQNKPTQVSSTDGYASGGDAAVDGNTATRWASAWSDPQWIYVDLGSVHTITRVVLNWEAAYGRAYQIQVSNDATTWTTITTESNSDGGIDDLTVSGSGRYVRMLGTTRATQWGYSLWEFQVYGTPVTGNQLTVSPASLTLPAAAGTGTVAITSNVSWSASDDQSWLTLSAASGSGNATLTLTATANTASTARTATVTLTGGGLTRTVAVTQAAVSSTTNVALNKPTQVSSTDGYAGDGSAAVDGNTGTRWASAFSDPQWIYVDLGSAHTITRVVLNWEAAYGSGYQIQVSNDASSWTTLYTESNGNGGIDDLTVSGSGRYVRMLGTARATQWGYSLWEFQVYGAPVTGNQLTASPATLSLTAAASSGSVAISSNVSWSASDDQSWLTLSPASGTNNGSLTLTATSNTTTSARTATVTVTGGGITRTVAITQAGTTSSTLSVSPTTLSLNAGASTATVTATANVSWTVTDDQSWLSASPTSGSSSGSFTVSATANTGTASRSGTITVTGGSLTRTIAVTQAASGGSNSVTLTAADAAYAGGAAQSADYGELAANPSSITWTFNAAVDGEYRISLRYSTPYGSKVNHFAIDGLSSAITFDSTTVATYTTTMQLAAGTHTVSLSADSGDWGYMRAHDLTVETLGGLRIVSPANFAQLPTGSSIQVVFEKVGTAALQYSVNGGTAVTYPGASPLVIPNAGDNVYRLNFTLVGTSISKSLRVTVGTPPSTGFVETQGTQFVLNGKPWYFSGTNQYYLMFKPKPMTDDFFDRAAYLGLNVVRTWMFCHHTATHDGACVNLYNGGSSSTADQARQHFLALKTNRTTQEQQLLDFSWGLLDHYVAKAEEKGIKLVLALGDNWPGNSMGGIDVFARAVGGNGIQGAYSNAEARKLYKMWITEVLNHVNTETGVAYKNDPTIAIWELANEPRCTGGSSCAVGSTDYTNFNAWIADISAHIKQLAPNQLVSIGAELDNTDTDAFVKGIHAHTSVDVVSAHLYPNAWNLTDAQTSTLIQSRINLARQIGKPLYYGEFSYLMQQSTAQADATHRAQLFGQWYDLAYANRDAMGGMISWQLSGLEWGNGSVGTCQWCSGPYGVYSGGWYGNHDGYQFYCAKAASDYDITKVGAQGTNVEGTTIHLNWHEATCTEVRNYSDQIRQLNQ